ncbi:MAG: arginine--tRNA ligase [Planctomycetota bacterium]
MPDAPPAAGADDPNQPSAIDPLELLGQLFSRAIERAYPDASGADPLVTRSRQPKLGDFQSNAAMPLGKRVGAKPREVAEQLAESLASDPAFDELCEPMGDDAIAGPGFINVRLRADALMRFADALDTPELGVEPPANAQTVVVDLCGVNLAKQMHVGHLRSTVIGDAIARLFERLGHRVIRQSHVGDWGLPIAMVVQKLIEREDAGGGKASETSLDDLNALYRAAQGECRAERVALASAQKYGPHPKAIAELEARIEHAEGKMEAAKRRLVALQSGEARSVAVWQSVYDITMGECLKTCARLHANVTDEHSAGESTYREELSAVVDDLVARGVAEESDGALVVRVDGVGEPCLIRKRDGGYLYATTDLAAIRRRVQRMGAHRVVYCVDSRQSLHFRQVFGAAHKAGYDSTEGGPARLEHAAFGSVMGEDNRPLKTRSGENVKLADLLDEAVQRADKTVGEKNEGMPAGDRAPIAEAVAMAAIKYADLSIERVKDYVFSFDRMLAFEGDTGPYLLNALVRIRSIYRRAEEQGVDTAGARAAPLRLDQPDERTLTLTLLRYPGVVRSAGEALEPSRLCAYLFELAGAFSGFYERCPVLRVEDEGVRDSRLRLCDLTARVLGDGLEALGIPTVDRM